VAAAAPPVAVLQPEAAVLACCRLDVGLLLHLPAVHHRLVLLSAVVSLYRTSADSGALSLRKRVLRGARARVYLGAIEVRLD